MTGHQIIVSRRLKKGILQPRRSSLNLIVIERTNQEGGQGLMLLSLMAYLAIILFLGLSARKAWEFNRMPIHGRMELYPVPKEQGHGYGGSYYEEAEWWQKEHRVSHSTELIEMLKEMLFIKKLFDNQRPLWWISYALHLGIYLLVAWTVCLVCGALTLLGGGQVGVSGGVWGSLLYYLTLLLGLGGLLLAAFGSGMLILRRVFDDTLRKYTTPQEYFNLALLYSAVVTGIFVWGKDLSFTTARELTASLITFTPFQASPLFILHLVLLLIMFTYIPLSKMSHYVGKYFSFHKVLWDNEPNLKGSPIHQKIRDVAAHPAGTHWSAPHISNQVKIEKPQ